MDVTRTLLPGTMPLWRPRALPAGLLAPGSAGGASERAPTAPSVADGGGTSEEVPELRGDPDGPDIVLASGLHVRRTHIGQFRVTDAELQQALRGIQLLPFADQQLVASLGIPIQLLPVAHLEQLASATDPVVGATLVTGDPGRGVPVKIRIASHMAQLGTPAQVQEAVQHEIGHAVSVVRRQDRSEAAAIAYAARY
jgi:hypothetical protein